MAGQGHLYVNILCPLYSLRWPSQISALVASHTLMLKKLMGWLYLLTLLHLHPGSSRLSLSYNFQPEERIIVT